MSTITLESVTAGYGQSLVLHEINLAFDSGFHVILGSNGAGKTTLFRVGVGILPPRAGIVSVLGYEPHRDSEVKRLIGYLPHRPSLSAALSVRDNLEFWGQVLRLPSAQRRSRMDQVIADLELSDLLSKPAASLSRGQAQRVAIARALLGAPQVLFLDEPTTGLDPLAARSLRELLKGLARADKTIIYSTHNLYEAAELADDVTLIAAGRVVDRGSVEALHQRHARAQRVCLTVEGDPRTILSGLGYEAVPDREQWIVDLSDRAERSRIVAALVQAGLPVLEVRELGSPLEAVYEDLESGGQRV
ncbi:MAG: ABC transporter ATP-binding protein [Thermogemmatispora sp.]|uniref:ABC transporter ATP-binding protein n=1 Tax=Thermogemmatispora sp. TaxID=1968838 RepID=UPI002609185B|nr:ABC transporter ATP-binding protein [Thermogemmatispora sp.]MBX5457388.1 ABC transporter ATP-binding protein [Thermogemmatispora sp.]